MALNKFFKKSKTMTAIYVYLYVEMHEGLWSLDERYRA